MPDTNAAEPRKVLVQELDRAQIDRLRVDVETVERRERRNENVELTVAGEARHRARDVRVVERPARVVDDEVRERPPRACTVPKMSPRQSYGNGLPFSVRMKIEVDRIRFEIRRCGRAAPARPCRTSCRRSDATPSCARPCSADGSRRRCRFFGSFLIARSSVPPPVRGSVGYTQFTSSSDTESPRTAMS